MRDVPDVERPDEIADRWRAEQPARPFIPRDVRDEFTRQGREAVRAREDNILERVEQGDASPGLLELAQQVRDHRDAGRYTTQG